MHVATMLLADARDFKQVDVPCRVPAMSTLEGVLSTEAADSMWIRHKMAAAWALKDLRAGFVEVCPEVLKFDHQARRCDRHSHLMLDL